MLSAAGCPILGLGFHNIVIFERIQKAKTLENKGHFNLVITKINKYPVYECNKCQQINLFLLVISIFRLWLRKLEKEHSLILLLQIPVMWLDW